MQTPWGKSDYKEELAPGVAFYSTPSHGGIKVSDTVMQWFPKCYQSTDGWYEEDCEVLKVMLAMPELFPKHDVNETMRQFRFWFNPDGSIKSR